MLGDFARYTVQEFLLCFFLPIFMWDFSSRIHLYIHGMLVFFNFFRRVIRKLLYAGDLLVFSLILWFFFFGFMSVSSLPPIDHTFSCCVLPPIYFSLVALEVTPSLFISFWVLG